MAEKSFKYSRFATKETKPVAISKSILDSFDLPEGAEKETQPVPQANLGVSLSENSPIRVEFTDTRYKLLKPCYVPQDLLKERIITDNVGVFLNWLQSRKAKVIALDTETNSLTVFGNKDFRIVGIGLCDESSGIYLDTSIKSFFEIKEVITSLKNLAILHQIKFIGHNFFYDLSTLAFYLGTPKYDENCIPIKACTHILFRMLSSEGWFGQRWSLEIVETTFLLWPQTNKDEIGDWLIERGYVQGAHKILDEDSDEVRLEKLNKIKQSKDSGKKVKADKSCLYKAPASVLGPYCILDCFATLSFYNKVLLPAIDKYTTPFFTWFHEEVSLGNVRCLVDNYQQGIFIDKNILLDFREELKESLISLRKKIYLENKEKIDEINAALLSEFYLEKSTLTKFKKSKKLGKEPIKFTKKGNIAQSWIKWDIKRQSLENQEPVETVAWKNFKELEAKIIEAQNTSHIYDTSIDEKIKSYIFNLNSVPHKTRLLYTDKVEYDVVEPWKDAKKKGLIRFKHNEAELEFSKSGNLPTGKAAVLAIMGKDSAVDSFTKELKKDQFAASTLEKLTPASRIHLPVKVQATLTTRNGGDGGLNINNLVKSPGYLKAWRVENPKTHVIGQLDVTALEPHVLTEASQDKAMLGLYGPGAPQNDVYIFGGSLMGGIMGQCFLDEGYDPMNPSKEILDLCKKKYKNIRNALKVVILSDDYGSGATKKWRTLKLSGYDFTLDQIKDVQQRLNKAFEGKKAFGKKLQLEHEKNGGWFLDGFGFPVAVDNDKIRDCTSRYCQRTGHLILLTFLWKLWRTLVERKIPYECMIWDYHDETIPIIPIEYADELKKIYAEIWDWMNNDFLKAKIKLKAEPLFASSLAGVKCEGYKDEDDEIKELLEELNEDH